MGEGTKFLLGNDWGTELFHRGIKLKEKQLFSFPSQEK